LQSYRQTVQQIARTSRWLAVMTPHAILAVAAVALKLMFPRPLRWLATETALVRVFSHWIPLVVTIALLYDASVVAEEDSKNKNAGQQLQQQPRDPLTPVQGRHNQRRKKSNTSSSSSKKRRQSVLDRVRRGSPEKQSEATISTVAAAERNVAAQQHEYWLHYWMICAALAALPTLFRSLPLAARLAPQWLGSVAAQLHLLFWIWIHLVPYMTPPQLRQQLEGATLDPVHWLVETVLAPAALGVYHGVSSGLVPAHVWETYVHQPAKKVLGLAATLKLVSARRQETWSHVIGESRGLLVPAVAVLSWPMAKYGLLYVQFVLPLALSAVAASRQAQPRPAPASQKNAATMIRWLQFWLLHCLVSVAHNALAGLLWWIPLSNVALWLVWAALATAPPAQLEVWYRHWVQRELQALQILPAPADDDVPLAVDHSKTVRAFYWIVERLPSAAESATEDETAPETEAAEENVPDEDDDGEEDDFVNVRGSDDDAEGGDDDEEYVPPEEGKENDQQQPHSRSKLEELEHPRRTSRRRRTATTTQT